jgi:hypothetical protein
MLFTETTSCLLDFFLLKFCSLQAVGKVASKFVTGATFLKMSPELSNTLWQLLHRVFSIPSGYYSVGIGNPLVALHTAEEM